ncbi:heat shock factor protein 5-like [Myiozetetes cayanensis]|uniref:heat shock factor protein 5-like n=1 Tax=Myiozetetes cayanensis TaxID=478635 RepID=UPI00215F7A17|nr:heat shock factor protein 5-like [Myiozetetes cayanensis]
MAAFLEENISILSESSGKESGNKAAAERASPGNVSCGNSSPEAEDTDIHLLYLSKRAALRGRKRPKPKSGLAPSGGDSCGSAGPGHAPQSPELPVDTKRLKEANKENLGTGLKVPERPPSRSQQRLDTLPSRDPPSANRNDASRTSEASPGLLPGHEASPALPEKVVATPRI